MDQTLFDLSLKLAKKLGAVREQLATGGSTTSLVDDEQLLEADDFWNEGTIWVTRDAAGAGGAPENEFSGIVDFTNSSGTADLHETLTQSIAVGDRYAIALPRYPLHDLIYLINEALDATRVSFTDKTSLSTVSGQTEYDLPSVAQNFDLRRVWEQRRTGASNDNQWVRLYDWDIERTDTGSPDRLVFALAPVGNRQLKLDFVDAHPNLYVASDELREHVHGDLIVANAAVIAMERRLQDPADEDPNIKQLLDRFDGQAVIAEAEKPIRNPQKNTKLLIFRDVGRSRYPGDHQPR